MNWSEEDLERIRREGVVQVIEETGGRKFTAAMEPLIKGKVSKQAETAAPAKKGTPVPQEHCLKAGVCFKNQTERESMRYLLSKYEPRRLLYEPMLIRLPGGNYTPDWLMEMRDGTLVFIEVKGTGGWGAHRSGRSSQKALKEAAYHMTFIAEFRLLTKQKDGSWAEKFY